MKIMTFALEALAFGGLLATLFMVCVAIGY